MVIMVNTTQTVQACFDLAYTGLLCGTKHKKAQALMAQAPTVQASSLHPTICSAYRAVPVLFRVTPFSQIKKEGKAKYLI